MKTLVAVVAVVLMLGIVSAGYCQWEGVGLVTHSTSARWMGVGGAGTAAATDEGAVDYNPASLAVLDLGAGTPGNDLKWRGSFTWGGGTFETSSLKLAASDPDRGWGAGVSFTHPPSHWDDDSAQVGYGWKLKKYPICLGASLANIDEHNLINVGGIYLVNQKKLPPVRLGAVVGNVNNVADESSWLNVGVAVPVNDRFFFALDGIDITESLWEAIYNFGMEYQFTNSVVLRAGSLDGAFAGGLGYQWNQWTLDLTFNQWSDDWGWWSEKEQWTITGGVNF